MVTAGELYALVMTVLALVALAAAIPVLRDIVREGRERLREGPAPPAAESESDDVAGVRCHHCGTINEAGFVYCEECSRQL